MKTLPIALAALLAAGIAPALAAPKPYEPVVVTYDSTGADEASLKEFVASLQKAVDNGDVALLKQSVSPDMQIYAPPIGFPDATPPHALANPDKHPGEQRLDEAAIMTTSSDVDFSREDLDGAIVDLFGTALQPATIGKSKIAGGALCSPAEPIFDRDKALALATTVDVPPGNLWILSEKTDFHEKPDAKSPVIETVAANTIVPFIEGSVDGATGEEGDEDWYSVALPSGKVGFASNDTSLAFQQTSVCYGKVDDHWVVNAVIIPSL